MQLLPNISICNLPKSEIHGSDSKERESVNLDHNHHETGI